MSDKSSSLRSTLLRYLIIPVVLLALFSATATYLIARNYAEIAFDHALRDTVESLEMQVTVRDGKPHLDVPETTWKILAHDPDDRIYFDIRRSDGAILAGETDIPDPPRAQQKAGQVIFSDATIQDIPVRIVSKLIQPHDADGHDTLLIQVAETLNKREHIAERILSTALLPQLLLVLPALALVWIGIARSLSPLEKLRHIIRNRSPGDLQPIALDIAPQELQSVVHAINELMERVNQLITAQQHFISNAAHQLRTPLAGLLTQAELALRLEGQDASHRSLHQIQEGAKRANRLVHQLLALARAEAMPSTTSADPVDLVALTKEVAMEWVTHALEKEIDLGFEEPSQSVWIMGQPTLLREMESNLLDNAIRYTPRRGRVTVRVEAGEKPRVVVEDSGPGIPPEESEQVFGRFYRLDSTGEPGSGLGLAIARQIAAAHSARVWLETTTSSGGVRVVVEFAGVTEEKHR